MKVPKQFAVKSDIWTVEFKWNLMYAGKHVDGLTDPTAKIIYIERSLSKEEKEITFRHEFRHAVFESYGIGFNHGGLKQEREEELLEALDIEEPKVFNFRWKKA